MYLRKEDSPEIKAWLEERGLNYCHLSLGPAMENATKQEVFEMFKEQYERIIEDLEAGFCRPIDDI